MTTISMTATHGRGLAQLCAGLVLRAVGLSLLGAAVIASAAALLS